MHGNLYFNKIPSCNFSVGKVWEAKKLPCLLEFLLGLYIDEEKATLNRSDKKRRQQLMPPWVDGFSQGPVMANKPGDFMSLRKKKGPFPKLICVPFSCKCSMPNLELEVTKKPATSCYSSSVTGQLFGREWMCVYCELENGLPCKPQWTHCWIGSVAFLWPGVINYWGHHPWQIT